MSGGALLALILISMGWLFFLAGLAANSHARRKKTRARLGFAPGVVGSITAFFTIPALAKYGVEVPWPWLWIVLPLLIEPVLMLFGNRMRGSKNGS